ncbi:UNVERIFIED_CONTAM: putative ribonuclease H protein [Sesamum latifolium]|uniref:Ribonuclease H protein n=1 Tax=Sesamum latifolium TaxID=2727402 RepID=A0AAW2XPJ9_9LAMI
MAKVAWSDVCRPLEEGGQGIHRLEPLNRALMSKHFWDILQCNSSSVWVTWIRQHYIGNCSIWTVRQTGGGSWSWRKILRLRDQLLSYIQYQVGSGHKFWVWHDPSHPLGPLIHRFPRGPVTTAHRHLGISSLAQKASMDCCFPSLICFSSVPLMDGTEQKEIWFRVF